MGSEWESNKILLNSIVGELRSRINDLVEKSKQNGEAIELVKALTEQTMERVKEYADECRDSEEIFSGLNKVIEFTERVEVMVVLGLEDASNILRSVQEICISVKDEILDDSVKSCHEIVEKLVRDMQEMRELVASVRSSQGQLSSRIDMSRESIIYH